MKQLKKWVINYDFATLVLGSILVYFSEDIVTLLYPLDPMPVETISILYYFMFFSVSAFWIFKGLTYWTIKLAWNNLYEYLEEELDNDFKQLTPWQRVSISLLFYLSLAFLLAITFSATAGVM